MKNDTDNTTTLTTPTRPDPVPTNQAGAVALAQMVKDMADNARVTLAAANAVAERELHDRRNVDSLSATVAVNRDLIRALQRTMEEHAQTIMQQREALDELATWVRLAEKSPPEPQTVMQDVDADAQAAHAQSDLNNVRAEERRHG